MPITAHRGLGWAIPLIPTHLGINTPSASTFATLDAASEAVAIICRYEPDDGASRTIQNILFRTGTVTTGGANDLDCRIETVDPTTGLPTGTLWNLNGTGASPNINHDLADANDNTWIITAALTNGAVLVKGDIFAVVIRQPAASFGNWALVGSAREFFHGPMGAADPTAAGWAKNNAALPMITVAYSDGSYGHLDNMMGFGVPRSTAFNSGSATNRRGNLFQLPYPVRAQGAWGVINPTAGADYSIRLYDSAGSQLATTGTIDGDTWQNSLRFHRFTTAVDLARLTNYRIAVVPETANNLSLYAFDVRDVSMMEMNPLGQFMFESLFTSSAWVDSATASRSLLGLVAAGFL